jgi:hypothetical protein
MFLLISVSSEAFSQMMVVRLLQKRLGVNVSSTRDAPELLRQVRGSLGGRLVLLDWSRREILADKAFPGATGLATQGRRIVAASWTDPYAYVHEDGEEIGKFTHRWFNYVHSVDLTPQGNVLFACAGSDLIAEFTLDGEALWDWFGAEHGYGVRPDGVPVFFDRETDYRVIRSGAAEHAMHVNSAIALPNNSVLATLFHQGALISIDRDRKIARVVLDGLSRPHGVHARNGGYLLSDTLGHRVVLLDERLQVCREIPVGTQWLQDAIVTSEGAYLTLENVHLDQLPERNLSNRIAEIQENGNEVRALEVGSSCRLFTVREVDEAHATALAAAWGRSGNLKSWRWT